MSDTNYATSFSKGGSSIGDALVIDFPEISTGKVNATTHASGGKTEYIPSGLIDAGDITLSIKVEANILDSMNSEMEAKTISECIIADSVDTLTFDGFYQSIKKEGADAQSPDLQKITVVITPTGGLTLTDTVVSDWWDLAVALSIVPAEFALVHPSTQQLTVYYILPNGQAHVAPAADLTWTSSVTGDATVNASGLVTTVSTGASTIKATVTDGGLLDAFAQVTVT